MVATPNPALRRRSLIAYFVLTYLISWAIEVPLALSYQGIISTRIPFALHYVASFGPLLAAVIVTLAAVGSVVYTWLYNGTGGRLLWLVLFHGLFDVHGPATLCPGDKVAILWDGLR